MFRDVGMAVPKTTETKCRDRAYKHCTNNPIPTSFFHAQCRSKIIKERCHLQKKCRDGVICAVFVCPVSTPSFCGFWHCHPYIPVHFWKMFYLLVCVIFLQYSSTPYIGGYCSSSLPSGTNKQTCDHRQLLLYVSWTRSI